MFVPAHLAAGLLIGKVTGNYPAALIGASLIDIDHLWVYLRHKLIFKPRLFLKVATTQEDPYGNQRNFLHNVFAWIIFSLIVVFIDFKFGLIFSFAYFSHILFDALDGGDFYPFYPFKNINLRGPIPYLSRIEIIFTVLLFIVFLFI
jgi:membrane-bound metal-dependent hydrolase YbcI (DUF457 family)